MKGVRGQIYRTISIHGWPFSNAFTSAEHRCALVSGTGVSKVSIMQSHGLRPHTNARIRVHPFRTTQPHPPNRLEAGLSNRHDVNYRLTTATAKPPCHPLDAYATFQISLCLYTILEYTLSFLIFFLSLSLSSLPSSPIIDREFPRFRNRGDGNNGRWCTGWSLSGDQSVTCLSDTEDMWKYCSRGG